MRLTFVALSGPFTTLTLRNAEVKFSYLRQMDGVKNGFYMALAVYLFISLLLISHLAYLLSDIESYFSIHCIHHIYLNMHSTHITATLNTSF